MLRWLLLLQGVLNAPQRLRCAAVAFPALLCFLLLSPCAAFQSSAAGHALLQGTRHLMRVHPNKRLHTTNFMAQIPSPQLLNHLFHADVTSHSQ